MGILKKKPVSESVDSILSGITAQVEKLKALAEAHHTKATGLTLEAEALYTEADRASKVVANFNALMAVPVPSESTEGEKV